MRKAIAIVWLLIYTLVSSGFTVHTHFCMNRVQGVGLGLSQSNTCQKCGMEKTASHGCCRDEVKVVKMPHDAQLDAVYSFAHPVDAALPQSLSHQLLPFYNFATANAAVAQNGPPLLPNNICILHQQFRI